MSAMAAADSGWAAKKADIAAGSVCRYLDVRFPEHPWRSRHPGLSTYSDTIEQRPSFQASVPVAQSISDKVV